MNNILRHIIPFDLRWGVLRSYVEPHHFITNKTCNLRHPNESWLFNGKCNQTHSVPAYLIVSFLKFTIKLIVAPVGIL